MILVLAGQKGGAGRSTTTAALAAELVRRGGEVLCVDADPQGTLRTWGAVGGEAGHPGPAIVAMGAGMHRTDQLPKVAAAFDVVIVDCPPFDGAIARSAIAAADRVVIPCGPSANDAWALAGSAALIEEARRVRPDLDAAVLVTRKQPGTAVARLARGVVEGAGLPVLDTELSYRLDYQEAFAAGTGPTVYAPKGKAADETRRLVDELFGKQPAPAKARHVRRKA